jgi:hypothetical protein
MKFVEAIGLDRKFGAMGHPSSETEWCRILGFRLERSTAGSLDI